MAKTSAAHRRGQVSRSRILATALELVDNDGLDALTMRRLADRLKVDPMSIYNYVDGRDGLLDGLAEALWEKVELPSDKANWKQVLRSFAVALRTLALDHPQAYGLLCRACLSEPALRSMDMRLAALETAGLDRARGAELLRTLFSYAVGYGLLELSATTPRGATELERLVNITRSVPREAPAHLVEVARLIADCDMDYQFELGLDLILSGLEARLQPPVSAQPSETMPPIRAAVIDDVLTAAAEGRGMTLRPKPTATAGTQIKNELHGRSRRGRART